MIDTRRRLIAKLVKRHCITTGTDYKAAWSELHQAVGVASNEMAEQLGLLDKMLEVAEERFDQAPETLG